MEDFQAYSSEFETVMTSFVGEDSVTGTNIIQSGENIGISHTIISTDTTREILESETLQSEYFEKLQLISGLNTLIFTCKINLFFLFSCWLLCVSRS